MLIILIILTLGFFVWYLLFHEHRKKARIAIVIVLVIDLMVFFIPTVRCAASIPAGSYATLKWKVISFHHQVCMDNNDFNEMMQP